MTSIIPVTPKDDEERNKPNGNAIDKTINWIMDVGISGIGDTLPSAQEVAEEHLKRCNGDVEKAVDSVIRWKTAYAGGSGFVTGFGGIVTLPVTLTVGLAASYAIAANQAAAIAYLRGYDVYSDQVRTAILMCLVGDLGEEILKTAGIAVGRKAAHHVVMHKIPKSLLGRINKLVGFKLIAKVNEKAAIRLIRVVPFVGGAVGGAVDGAFVNICGRSAKQAFPTI
ncbi:MAG: EcsC family protein [Cyanobacteria bacterium J06649_4]